MPLPSSVSRRWVRQLPNPFKVVGNQGPDQPTTILDRVDLSGQGLEHNEVVWDHTARLISPSQRIKETQRNQLGLRHRSCSAPPGFQPVLDPRECLLVDRERILESPVTEESETPRSSPSGPDEAHL